MTEHVPLQPGSELNLVATEVSRPAGLRPYVVVMFFLALSLLGLFAASRIHIELVPALQGERLFIAFSRADGDPEVLEREILLPLERRVQQISGVVATQGEIRGQHGSLQMTFAYGAYQPGKELEVQQIVAEISRAQPRGSRIEVSSQDLSVLSRFVMSIRVSGSHPVAFLRQLAEQQLQSPLAAVGGVSRVFVSGGRSQQVEIEIDVARAASAGLTPLEIRRLVQQALPGRILVGSVSDQQRKLQVQLDGEASSVTALRQLPLRKNLQLQHVAMVHVTDAPQQTVYRVNGKDAVGLLIFQQDNANLVELGQKLRTQLAQLNQQYKQYGITLDIGFDAAEQVTTVLSRLQYLALTGLLIALLILYLFMRELHAVLVIVVAVPISLLCTIGFLYLAGYSLNVVTLFGLTIGVGMLVDNSIVVYEAVQRGLDVGQSPTDAAANGVKRTARAIVAASATNVVVFIPLLVFTEDALQRALLQVVAVSVLLPLLASLIVAVTVVPLLTTRLAGARQRQPQQLVDPSPWLAIALLKLSLRYPLRWGMALSGLLLFTLCFALPLVLVRAAGLTNTAATEFKTDLQFSGGQSLQTAGNAVSSLEQRLQLLPGVQRVESSFDEQRGTITVYLPADPQPGDMTVAQVRQVLHEHVAALKQVQLKQDNDEQLDQQISGGQWQHIALTGPDVRRLYKLAQDIRQQLVALPQISATAVSATLQGDVLAVQVVRSALVNHALLPESVLTTLNYSGREGQLLPATLQTDNGYPLPLLITDKSAEAASPQQHYHPYYVPVGSQQIPLHALTEMQQESSAPALTHHNGLREVRVSYQLRDSIAADGPERAALQMLIRSQANTVYRPTGYTLEWLQTEPPTDRFRRYFVPAVLLLFVVLAVTFESVALPWLVLLAVPLSLVGSVWGLLLGGYGVDLMSILGAVVLLGLAVNPAILLVDYMHQRRQYRQPAAAALLAVRERTRPVLMAAATTAAGLWPMAITAHGQAELWSSFATVMIGGVISVTALTLLVVPVGYVMLCRIQSRLNQLPRRQLWSVCGATLFCFSWLVYCDVLQQSLWQLSVFLLLASGALFGLHRYHLTNVSPASVADPLRLDARYLSKVYQQAGFWQRISQQMRRRRGMLPPGRFWQHVLHWLLLAAGPAYLAVAVFSPFWALMWALLAAALIAIALAGPGHSSRKQLLLWCSPWVVWLWFSLAGVWRHEPGWWEGATQSLVLAVAIAAGQLARRRARQLLDAPDTAGQLKRFGGIRRGYDLLCNRLAGFGLPRQSFVALSQLNLTVSAGLIGVLGPNGAGKSTFLRLMAGVLTPSSGALWYRGRAQKDWGAHLSDMIGYLPQDFGLYGHLTVREYLEYFALLYRIGDVAERAGRIRYLLTEVGLLDRQQLTLRELSGGMQRRVGVARALLRLPAIIIVDEPTVGLDPYERIKFRNLLSHLAKDRIVLFSTHVIEDVEVSCDRVVVLNRGRLLYDDTPQALAQLAAGKVWHLHVADSEVAAISQQFKVVTQVPEESGMVRLRLLSAAAPSAGAIPEIANLEDGYLQLFMQEAHSVHADQSIA